MKIQRITGFQEDLFLIGAMMSSIGPGAPRSGELVRVELALVKSKAPAARGGGRRAFEACS